MTGSSSTSSAWTLLLTLLAVFIFSSPVYMFYLPSELSADVDALKECSSDLSKPDLSLSAPQSECPFPYFLAGIKSLNCDDSPHITNLERHLRGMDRACQERKSNCTMNVLYEPRIPPQTFQQRLKDLVQQINDQGCYRR